MEWYILLLVYKIYVNLYKLYNLNFIYMNIT